MRIAVVCMIAIGVILMLIGFFAGKSGSGE
jgi:hypothetical protein